MKSLAESEAAVALLGSFVPAMLVTPSFVPTVRNACTPRLTAMDANVT
jgi:hypothetical protein